MIGNSRQLTVAQRKLRALTDALEASTDALNSMSYRELINDLRSEIEEFERIRDGYVRQFSVSSVDDLGPAVVKARIASGLNQRQLAEEMDVSEQAVQKDESTLYERAGLARIAEILDALEHELVGVVRPRGPALPTQLAPLPAAVQGRVRNSPPLASRQNVVGRYAYRLGDAPAVRINPGASSSTAASTLKPTNVMIGNL